MKKQSKYYEELTADVIADFKRRQEQRKSFELQWRLNMNFFIGNQFSEITPQGDIDDVEKLFFWQERGVYNHITPIIETRLAKLGLVKSDLNVRPATSSDDDINAAKFISGMLTMLFSKLEVDNIVSEATMWSEMCGSAFYKVGWVQKPVFASKEKSKDVAEQVTKETQEAQVKEGSQQKERVRIDGDVDLLVCPPFEIYPDDINAFDLKSLKSLIHAKTYTVDEIKEIWGVVTEPDDDVNAFSASRGMSQGAMGYTHTIKKALFERKENTALVIERYTAPNKDNPEGVLTIVAGDKLVYHGAIPFLNAFSDSPFPFIRQNCVDQAGFFFGTSIIERLIPIQRAYNAIRNRKHEYLNRIAMGVLAVEDGSVDTDNLEEDGLGPGKILIYRQGGTPPRMLDLGRVPPDFAHEEDKLLSEFVLISGISEFMRFSGIPRTVTSGIALSLLMEQDEMRLNITARGVRSAIKGLGLLLVGLYKKFAHKQKLMRLHKDGSSILFDAFIKRQLTKDDVIIENDTDMTDTPAGRRSMLVELLKLGLLADQNGKLSDRTRHKALEIMGLGNWENSRDLDEVHLRRAAEENAIFTSGNDTNADSIDNHELHIDEHIKFAVSNKNTTAAEVAKRHIEQHKIMQSLQIKEL